MKYDLSGLTSLSAPHGFGLIEAGKCHGCGSDEPQLPLTGCFFVTMKFHFSSPPARSVARSCAEQMHARIARENTHAALARYMYHSAQGFYGRARDRVEVRAGFAEPTPAQDPEVNCFLRDP